MSNTEDLVFMGVGGGCLVMMVLLCSGVAAVLFGVAWRLFAG